MIMIFFIAVILTLLTESQLHTGWLVHALLFSGVAQILWTIIKSIVSEGK